MLISLCLLQSKYTEMHKQRIPFISYNPLEFICVPLQAKCLPDLHEKFQVASTYNAHVKY